MAIREMADFLRSRRDRIGPAAVGLPEGGRRRTPGLRRAEVAMLAGISPDYYMRLEQGRGTRPSPSVLDGLARALVLNEHERDHLYRLALELPSPPPANGARPADDRVEPNVLHLLDAIGSVPAYVINGRLDVLAWNRAAALLMCELAELPESERNILRYVFGDPRARSFYANWDEVARHGVAQLRTATGRDPGNPKTEALIRELSSDPTFRACWARQDVQGPATGMKAYCHPLVGRISLEYIGMLLPGVPEHQFITFTAADPASQVALEEVVAPLSQSAGK
ncbi:helix-turn-helix transcriptional regulator [Actinomadura rupiterrae]|uniref:helix-turn-helix transcriptional regulator n=1 Tax=Actinomadura rupiterrae TaxID=559627 RepID=UPI0020A2E221|nr:helix-turn-helix transcriptional regulator [Actinomadura rupiterrae]MCP2335905.1 transcriptional regulator with XRE-family HTH domain [Actinomadura rupiterrae]